LLWNNVCKSEKQKHTTFHLSLLKGVLVTDQDKVLDYWKDSFKDLLNGSSADGSSVYSQRDVQTDHNSYIPLYYISLNEVKRAIDKADVRKACGVDNISNEAFKNDTAVLFLHLFFNVCFETGQITKDWERHYKSHPKS
jgi:hypothetical protein